MKGDCVWLDDILQTLTTSHFDINTARHQILALDFSKEKDLVLKCESDKIPVGLKVRHWSHLKQVLMSRQATQETGEGFGPTDEILDESDSERLLEETSREYSEGQTKNSPSQSENEDSGSFLKIFCFKDAKGFTHCISCTFKIENGEGQVCSICGIAIHVKCLNMCRLPSNRQISSFAFSAVCSCPH